MKKITKSGVSSIAKGLEIPRRGPKVSLKELSYEVYKDLGTIYVQFWGGTVKGRQLYTKKMKQLLKSAGIKSEISMIKESVIIKTPESKRRKGYPFPVGGATLPQILQK